MVLRCSPFHSVITHLPLNAKTQRIDDYRGSVHTTKGGCNCSFKLFPGDRFSLKHKSKMLYDLFHYFYRQYTLYAESSNLCEYILCCKWDY